MICPHCGTALRKETKAHFAEALIREVVTNELHYPYRCRDLLAAQVRERDQRIVALERQLNAVHQYLDKADIPRTSSYQPCPEVAPVNTEVFAWNRVAWLRQERDELRRLFNEHTGAVSDLMLDFADAAGLPPDARPREIATTLKDRLAAAERVVELATEWATAMGATYDSATGELVGTVDEIKENRARLVAAFHALRAALPARTVEGK